MITPDKSPRVRWRYPVKEILFSIYVGWSLPTIIWDRKDLKQKDKEIADISALCVEYHDAIVKFLGATDNMPSKPDYNKETGSTNL